MEEECTEADALNDQWDEMDDELLEFLQRIAIRRELDVQGRNSRSWRQAAYDETKRSAVRDKCICAGCGKPFTKRTYQHTFCSNKGVQNCKDKYWNVATDERWSRTVEILMKEFESNC